MVREWVGWGLVRALPQGRARVAQIFLILDFGFRMRVELDCFELRMVWGRVGRGLGVGSRDR